MSIYRTEQENGFEFVLLLLLFWFAFLNELLLNSEVKLGDRKVICNDNIVENAKDLLECFNMLTHGLQLE